MTDNEFDRTARAWLADGPNQISDRALRAALDEIHVTRQRRAWWPARRLSRMSNPHPNCRGCWRAILLAASSAFRFSCGRLRVEASAAYPLSDSDSIADADPVLADHRRCRARFQPGTYVTADPFLARVTFTVPAGWEGIMGGPYLVDLGKTAGPGAVASRSSTRSTQIRATLAKGPLDPLPGPSVDDLATALAGLPGPRCHRADRHHHRRLSRGSSSR